MQESGIQVSLFGKYPLSSEYLHIGESSSFTNSILSWIQAGYEALLKKRQKYVRDRIHHLYFSNREGASCVYATLRLSKDSKGREYPLIVLVEVSPSNEEKMYDTLWRKNLEVFQGIHTLEKLESTLEQYQLEGIAEGNLRELDEGVLATFVSEDFSKSKHFYRSLQVDDFIEMMR